MPNDPSENVWPALRRERLAERVAQIIKSYIVTQQLRPGHRLASERKLAVWLNVSRTVLREALEDLINQGVLHRASPHALRVTDFDRSFAAAELWALRKSDIEARDLLELRFFLEIGAITEIANRATDKNLREIERWVKEGERCVETHEPVDSADARFHAALLHVLGNRVIDSFLPVIEDTIRSSILADPDQLASIGRLGDRQTVEEHRTIFEAVQSRDHETARRVMLTHLARQWDRMHPSPKPSH
jgi:GntR family transcriptional repressor for pyruvate dehydrogenase complex